MRRDREGDAMTTARNACQAFVSTGAVVAVMALALQAADPPDFKADVTFTGSSLAGWHVLGQADWTAHNGELVGRPTAETGGWLMMNTPLQDLQCAETVTRANARDEQIQRVSCAELVVAWPR